MLRSISIWTRASLKFIGSRQFLMLLLCLLILADGADAAKKARRKSKRRYPLVSQEKPVGLRVDIQAARDSLVKLAATPAIQVDVALRLGTFRESDSACQTLLQTDRQAAWQARARDAFLNYRFRDARTALDSLMRYPATDVSRSLYYRWELVRENLGELDRLTNEALARNPEDLPALLARGELLLRMLRPDEALEYFARAYKLAPDDMWRAQARVGTGRALHRLDRYQAAFDTLKTLITPGTLHDSVMVNMGLSLIALGRVGEAIDLFEEATAWNPNNEMAHYYLGNGYARLDYTQLAKKSPAALATGAAVADLELATDALRHGNPAQAKAIALQTANRFPRVVEPPVLLGSIAWTEGKFDEAAEHFRAALRILPAYGRAQSGLAKSLEGLRLAQNAHRADDSAAFAAKPMPDLPRIGEFVMNWQSLSPRHQKQMALAIAPWKAYLPVLIECGNRFYIKPLYEKLSQCPGQQALKDTRIEYDSRLWDDVRGCGGYMTVTGIEDVERSIYSQYNTVLHELTHQVHSLFPPDDLQRVNDAFIAARLREDGGRRTFLSRYQQSSVEEYFAEGVNAYYSPQRDAYDTRDIVRERLLARDSALVTLVDYYTAGPNLTACYAVGLVNAAENAVENERVDDALSFAQRAYARDPKSESALKELSRVYSLLDRDSLALSYADTLIARFPHKAAAYTQKATARAYTDGNEAAVQEILERALSAVDTTERKVVRRALGRALWYNGRYRDAEMQYRAILTEVPRDPEALWGLGLALGDGGNLAGADSAFKQALLMRSGIVELRLDYARVLLQAGQLDAASTQIEEAQLLARGDPLVVTMKGWLMAERGEWKLALSSLERAIDMAPDQRLASVLRIKVLKHYAPPVRKRVRKYNPVAKEAALLAEAAAKDIPSWVFLPRKMGYVPAKTWPFFQREMLKQLTAATNDKR